MNSCKDCINAQAYLNSIKYIRVQNADIMIVACPKHLAMMKDTYKEMRYLTIEDFRS
jgi:hypothetical protein